MKSAHTQVCPLRHQTDSTAKQAATDDDAHVECLELRPNVQTPMRDGLAARRVLLLFASSSHSQTAKLPSASEYVLKSSRLDLNDAPLCRFTGRALLIYCSILSRSLFLLAFQMTLPLLLASFQCIA